MDTSKLAHPKPRSRKSLKARKARQEAQIKKLVRVACVVRDGKCRLCNWEQNPEDIHSDGITGDGFPAYECSGPSEWAHFAKSKRARTRGMTAEERHNTAGSLMLCRSAHRDHDAGKLMIQAETPFGCDGVLTFWLA